jgi:hypothetical protein
MENHRNVQGLDGFWFDFCCDNCLVQTSNNNPLSTCLLQYLKGTDVKQYPLDRRLGGPKSLSRGSNLTKKRLTSVDPGKGCVVERNE